MLVRPLLSTVSSLPSRSRSNSSKRRRSGAAPTVVRPVTKVRTVPWPSSPLHLPQSTTSRWMTHPPTLYYPPHLTLCIVDVVSVTAATPPPINSPPALPHPINGTVRSVARRVTPLSAAHSTNRATSHSLLHSTPTHPTLVTLFTSAVRLVARCRGVRSPPVSPVLPLFHSPPLPPPYPYLNHSPRLHPPSPRTWPSLLFPNLTRLFDQPLSPTPLLNRPHLPPLPLPPPPPPPTTLSSPSFSSCRRQSSVSRRITRPFSVR